jgi:phosphatidylinositol-3-phosphatase
MATGGSIAVPHRHCPERSHVQASDAEKAKLVSDTNLAADLADRTAPNFAFIVPDQCHELHGIGGACTGDQLFAETDQYLSSTVDEIVHSDVWKRGRNALVVTFDEGDSTLGCCDANPGRGRIVTVVVRNEEGRALQDPTPYNHYSLVATLQAAFGRGCQFNGTPVGLTGDTGNGVRPMAMLFGLR